jgi:hypothetical protein
MITSINALAKACSVAGNRINSTDALAAEIAAIVGKPCKVRLFTGGFPVREIRTNRVLPCVLTGAQGGAIRVTRESGLATTVTLPASVDAIDAALHELGARLTKAEQKLEEFKAALLEKLDAYGRLSFAVHSIDEDGDLSVYADAALGRFGGALWLAYHVVADSESGGFVETVEAHVVPVTGAPLRGVLSGWEYVDTAKAGAEFDAHVAALWCGSEDDISLDSDEA